MSRAASRYLPGSGVAARGERQVQTRTRIGSGSTWTPPPVTATYPGAALYPGASVYPNTSPA